MTIVLSAPWTTHSQELRDRILIRHDKILFYDGSVVDYKGGKWVKLCDAAGSDGDAGLFLSGVSPPDIPEFLSYRKKNGK